MESWRLRELAAQPGCPRVTAEALSEAADDLVRLRAELAAVRAITEIEDEGDV
jgi:hypothetical protein